MKIIIVLGFIGLICLRILIEYLSDKALKRKEEVKDRKYQERIEQEEKWEVDRLRTDGERVYYDCSCCKRRMFGTVYLGIRLNDTPLLCNDCINAEKDSKIPYKLESIN